MTFTEVDRESNDVSCMRPSFRQNKFNEDGEAVQKPLLGPNNDKTVAVRTFGDPPPLAAFGQSP